MNNDGIIYIYNIYRSLKFIILITSYVKTLANNFHFMIISETTSEIFALEFRP